MVPDASNDAGSPGALRCAECSARLAYDQRYCLECGARRGPVSHRFGQSMAAMLERGESPGEPGGGSDGAHDGSPDAEAPLLPEWMPAPRATAFAILIMLAFGVFAGSLASPTVASLARQIIFRVSHPAAAPAPAAEASGSNSGGGGDNSSGGGTITQTVTQSSPQTTTPGSSQTGSSGGGSAAQTQSHGPALGLPAVHHVFLIVLSGQGVFQTFGLASSNRYFAHTLAGQGEVLENYYGVAGSPLANGIALLSGQGPNIDTAIDCPFYSPVTPGTSLSHGQVSGAGCVYPPNTLTVADQLTTAQLKWRAYIQGAGGTHGRASTCIHPDSGAPDNHATPGRRTQYVTWRNPFVYFGSLAGTNACRDGEVPFGHLASDIRQASTAPALAYIVPSPCNDGSDTPCRPGAPAGLPPAARFLKSVVPAIKHSPAYKDHGLIIVTFDEAAQTGAHADHSACCSTPAYPNLPAGSGSTPTSTTPTSTTPTTTTITTTTSTTPTTTSTTPTTTSTTGTTSTTTSTTGTTSSTTPTTTSTTPTTTTPTTPTTPTGGPTTPTGGGGDVGLLLISPFVKPGTNDLLDYYNHYSLLALIENVFGLSHLGYAADKNQPVIDASIFNGG